MHHGWGALIAYASQACTLHPGEVLGSGTVPGGAGVESGRLLRARRPRRARGRGHRRAGQPDRPADPERPAPARRAGPRRGWRIAAFALRPQVVGVGPILEQIRDDLGMSHGAAGLLATIPCSAWASSRPRPPTSRRGWAPGRAVTVALPPIGGGGLVRAAAPGAWLLMLLTFPIGIGMGMGNALMPVAVKERFAVDALRATSRLRRRHPARRHAAGQRSPCRSPILGSGDNGWRHRARGLQHVDPGLPGGLGAAASDRVARRRGRPALPAPPRLPWRSQGCVDQRGCSC
jgi:hypothetical protein